MPWRLAIAWTALKPILCRLPAWREPGLPSPTKSSMGAIAVVVVPANPILSLLEIGSSNAHVGYSRHALGTIFLRPVVMGPRFRADDSGNGERGPTSLPSPRRRERQRRQEHRGPQVHRALRPAPRLRRERRLPPRQQRRRRQQRQLRRPPSSLPHSPTAARW